MVMTDPIADFLTRIRNANQAKHEVLEVPASNIKKGIAEILKREGFVKNVEVIEDDKQGIIRVFLKYGQNGERVITNLIRSSIQGLLVYSKREDVLKVLNGLGIGTDLHYKTMAELNGSEKVKVLLAKALFGNPDSLLLDEPTNHLDSTSKEILENALNSYTGTVLFVSHDRYYINSTATRIIELAKKTVVNYIGNYDYYLEKKDILGAKPITNNISKSSSSAISKLNWQEEKVKQAQQKKIKNEIKRTEERMALIEAEIV